MYVDPASLLFQDIPSDMREEMFRVAEEIVLAGDLPHPQPDWVTMWFEAGGFDERQRLMVFSTVFPVRVFLSLLREGEFGQ